MVIVGEVTWPEEEPPQAEQRQRDAQQNAKMDEYHTPIIENAAKPSNDRRRKGAVGE